MIKGNYRRKSSGTYRLILAMMLFVMGILVGGLVCMGLSMETTPLETIHTQRLPSKMIPSAAQKPVPTLGTQTPRQTVKPREENRNSTQFYTKGEKIDIVIPWVNYTQGYAESQTIPFDFGVPVDRIFKGIGLDRGPWTEICWTVRSYLHWDTKHVIGNIYVVYNGHRHLPPLCLEGFKQVIPITLHSLLQGTHLDVLRISSPRPSVVHSYLHRIPGLRPFFLFSMDDIFLTGPLDISHFYGFENHKIKSHMTGGKSGISPGQRESNEALEAWFHKPSKHSDALHVPFLVRTCDAKAVETHFRSTLMSKCGEPVHLCTFAPGIHWQTLVQNYMILVSAAQNEPADHRIFAEIHTTENSDLVRILAKPSRWIDIQGIGISDEYIPKEYYTTPRVRTNMERLRREFDQWLQAQPFF